MAPFHLWQLSRSFTYGMLILLLGALFAYLTNLNNASALVCAVECIVGWPLVLMGLCFLAFLMRTWPNGRIFPILLCISCCFCIPYGLYGLGALGLIDKTLRLRKKFLSRGQ